MKIETYTAIYKKGGVDVPVALFLNPDDATEWHANPELYSNCRRRVIISPVPKPKAVAPETEAMRLLRILVTPGEDSDDQVGTAIEQGQKLLGIKS